MFFFVLFIVSKLIDTSFALHGLEDDTTYEIKVIGVLVDESQTDVGVVQEYISLATFILSRIGQIN